jgi:hypothetical protein
LTVVLPKLAESKYGFAGMLAPLVYLS